MEIGKLIKNRRTELNLTLKDLANKIGVSSATIKRYETEEIELTLQRIMQLSKALDLDPAVFVTFKEIKSDPFKSLEDVLREVKNQSKIINFEDLPDELKIKIEMASRKAAQDYYNHIVLE